MPTAIFAITEFPILLKILFFRNKKKKIRPLNISYPKDG